MVIFFVVLTTLSILALLAGFVWVLVSKGESSQSSGHEVGVEIIGKHIEDDEVWSITKKSAFRGKAGAVNREVSISFSDVKRQVRSGNWRESLPLLLAVGGFLGLLLFGSLALFFALDDKLVGGLIAGIVIFTVARIILQMLRA